MLKEGQEFKGYLVQKILGETALSVTFLAESREVVKVFRDETFESNGGYEHLQRARKAITDNAIFNPNYLSFYTKVAREEVAPGRTVAWAVRGYVEGEDLNAWRTQARSFEEIRTLLRKICLGLDHLHRGGLIHGGLCPRNVILEGSKLKLTDFGTGSGFLGTLLGLEINPESLHFLPPWRHDPEKFQSPITDIYALGVLLFLLQRGTFPGGMLHDPPTPVLKALRGEYRDIHEFLLDIEQMAADEKQGSPEEGEKGPGASGEKERKGPSGLNDIPPEAAPNVDITGEGIERQPSGLDYLLKTRIKLKKSRETRTFFFVRNLQQDGKALKVKVVTGPGCEWIKAKPAEVELLPEKQRFDLSFGPFATPGTRHGNLVLEISFADSSACITRNIAITVDAGSGVVRTLLPLIPEWRKWCNLPVALVCSVIVAAGIFYYLTSPGPLRESRQANEHSPPAHSPLPSQPSSAPAVSSSSSPNPIVAAPPPPQVPAHPPPDASSLTSEVLRIGETLLARGEFLSAREDLTKLWASNPGNREVGTLINQMTAQLTILTALIPSPGQGEKRHGDLAVISSEHGFKVEFTPNDNCYLYVYHLDSHKNVTQLFPNTEASQEVNPLLGGKTYRIPKDYFILDQNTGLETIFFVASRLPATDLEDCYAKLAGVSAGQQRDTYFNDLIKRINVRRHAMDAGIRGCLFHEKAFWHGET
jgi:serine/threonine protein kinase